MSFDSGAVLHAHLTGSFAVGRQSTLAPWRRRVELVLALGVLVGEDTPILGMLRQADIERKTSIFGPDLCGLVPPDPEVIIRRLKDPPGRPLAGALLDQRSVAGFGNVYANELPYIAGLHPTPPADIIGDLAEVVRLGIGLIRYNSTTGYQNTTGRKLATPVRFIFARRGGRCPI